MCCLHTLLRGPFQHHLGKELSSARITHSSMWGDVLSTQSPETHVDVNMRDLYIVVSL